MQVRLAYSIAIQVDFDILLLDEVLAVGDEAFQEKCFATFDRLRARGEDDRARQPRPRRRWSVSATARSTSRNGRQEMIGSTNDVIDLYAQHDEAASEAARAHVDRMIRSASSSLTARFWLA